MSLIGKVFLIFPLLCYVHIWLVFVFNINIIPDWLFYDPQSIAPTKGLLPDDLIPVLFFIGTPVSFFVGSIYTAYKQLWWWFGAYMILGLGIYCILRF